MATGKVTFRLNPGFEEQIMGSSWLRALMEELVRQVGTAAQRLSPYAHGHLRRGIKGVVGVDVGRWIIGRVFDDDFKAHWHEFGTRKMHPHPYLRPALSETLPGATITGGRGRSG